MLAGGIIMQFRNKIITLILVVFLTSVFGPIVASASSTWYDGHNKSWRYRLDSPEPNGKDYWHIHFYESGTEKFCLRLDNMKPCDYNKNKKYYTDFEQLPNKLIAKVTNNSAVQKAIEKEKPKVNSWVDSIPKWALVSVAALAVFLATVTWFFPGDDIGAWALFLRAMAL